MGENIDEDIEILRNPQKMELTQLIRTFKREGIENFVTVRKETLENVLSELKRYKNMYNAEHEIHLVRNEQLARKEKAIRKTKELENKNIELQWELETYKKIVDELKNKEHYKIFENCNKEYRTKRSYTKYCKECAKKKIIQIGIVH